MPELPVDYEAKFYVLSCVLFLILFILVIGGC